VEFNKAGDSGRRIASSISRIELGVDHPAACSTPLRGDQTESNGASISNVIKGRPHLGP